MEWLLDGVSKLFGWLVNKLINWIVVPFVQLIILVIKYITATIFYTISSFLLQIIDFLEMLFRALAGLPANSDSYISFSFGGKEGGDLLIQILTSKEIMMAFEATAIVGIFLLIITTIFQMIKVEYTTEGAENNKTKIIGKSLKSLSNLLLIPALCVFGVFIGNQVLDLIDTATKGNSSAKISGTLWVTAASDALVDSRADQIVGQIFMGALAMTGGDISTASAIGGVSAAIAKLGETMTGSGWGSPVSYDEGVKEEFPDRQTIENGFMTVQEGFAYFSIGNVVKYYNIYEVNYIVLLFGGCVVLKSLFHICFGMVDRLYRCIALFIVAPFVIGMSPVKDSLASWRTNFIGKALAAYGTIISMNLFFTIVSVLLSVEVDVVLMGPWAVGGGDGNIMVDSFYEGLIKFIFVIVGVLMIEKLASEMGNYFGASDGLATGKALANEAAEPAKKIAGAAIGVAAGVATGGASFAMKAAGGISKAVGAGKAAKAGGGSAFKAFNKSVAGDIGTGIKSGAKKAWNATGGRITSGISDAKNLEENRKELSTVSDRRKETSSKINSNKKLLEDVNRYEELFNKGSKRTGDEDREMSAIKKRNKDHDLRSNNLEYLRNKANTNLTTLQNQDALDKATEEDLDKKVKHGELSRAKGVAYYGAAKNFGKKSIMSFLPKGISGFGKELEKEMEEGTADSEYGKAAMATIKGAKSDQKEKAWENDFVNARFVAQQQAYMNAMLKDETSKRMIEQQEESNSKLSKMNRTLEELVQEMKNAHDNEDFEGEKFFANQIRSTQREMKEINGSINFNGKLESLSDAELKGAFGDSERKIKAEIDKLYKIFDSNQGKSNKEILKALDEHVAKLGRDGDDKMMKQVMKALEEIKSNLGK